MRESPNKDHCHKGSWQRGSSWKASEQRSSRRQLPEGKCLSSWHSVYALRDQVTSQLHTLCTHPAALVRKQTNNKLSLDYWMDMSKVWHNSRCALVQPTLRQLWQDDLYTHVSMATSMWLSQSVAEGIMSTVGCNPKPITLTHRVHVYGLLDTIEITHQWSMC